MKKPHRRLTERQEKILIALAHAGERGLSMDEIMAAWGWDGTNVDSERFKYDWNQLIIKNPHSMEKHMASRPFYLHGQNGPARFSLSNTARNYLIENGII